MANEIEFYIISVLQSGSTTTVIEGRCWRGRIKIGYTFLYLYTTQFKQETDISSEPERIKFQNVHLEVIHMTYLGQTIIEIDALLGVRMTLKGKGKEHLSAGLCLGDFIPL